MQWSKRGKRMVWVLGCLSLCALFACLSLVPPSSAAALSDTDMSRMLGATSHLCWYKYPCQSPRGYHSVASTVCTNGGATRCAFCSKYADTVYALKYDTALNASASGADNCGVCMCGERAYDQGFYVCNQNGDSCNPGTDTSVCPATGLYSSAGTASDACK